MINFVVSVMIINFVLMSNVRKNGCCFKNVWNVLNKRKNPGLIHTSKLCNCSSSVKNTCEFLILPFCSFIFPSKCEDYFVCYDIDIEVYFLEMNNTCSYVDRYKLFLIFIF